jgi:hypothetical protein
VSAFVSALFAHAVTLILITARNASVPKIAAVMFCFVPAFAGAATAVIAVAVLRRRHAPIGVLDSCARTMSTTRPATATPFTRGGSSSATVACARSALSYTDGHSQIRLLSRASRLLREGLRNEAQARLRHMLRWRSGSLCFLF